ncbi:MAG: hypothetical protein HC927_09415 [Deltaproteobacteria bacterium]|nr:hypothetical protein [Deltaproteobacteria bacterium]
MEHSRRLADHLPHCRLADHLPRERFIALLKRLVIERGCIVGNSSAGLIEAAALALPAVNLGPRQAGRERHTTVLDITNPDPAKVREAIDNARKNAPWPPSTAFGDGHASSAIARTLASIELHDPALLRKRAAD